MSNDAFKKAILLGVGVGTMTKEKIEALVKEMEKRGHVSAKDGKKLVNDLIKEAEKTQKQAKDFVTKQVNAAIKAMPIVTKKDLEELEKRLGKKKK